MIFAFLDNKKISKKNYLDSDIFHFSINNMTNSILFKIGFYQF